MLNHKMQVYFLGNQMEDEDDKLCTTLTVLSAHMLQHINML